MAKHDSSSSSLSASSSSSSCIDCEMSRLVLGSGGHAPLFTVAQWAEMEHQALVFKYLKAGLPVPPDLLLPIRNSFNLISPSFLRQHPALTYASFCGKKIDPEPGRCRRTDGKKWRCSKDAHPDSKYCERHMNRGRYRSRKLVESQTALQSMSTITSDMKTGSRSNSGSFQNIPSHSGVSSGCLSFGSDASQLRMEPIPYGIVTRGNRVLDGAEEHNFMSEDSGSARSLGVDSTVDSPWSLMTSRVPLNSSSQPRSGPLFLSNSSQSQTMQDIQPLTVDTTLAKQQQRQYVGGEFGVLRSIKQEQQPLQPFFDEWPKSRDLGFYPKDHRSTSNLSNPGQQPMSNATTPSNFFVER